MKGKIALVTGGSRGIGRAIATALVSAGAITFITGRDRIVLEKTASEIEALPLVCDHAREEEVEAALAKISASHGRIDILINNAGANHALAEIDKLDANVWRQCIDVNLNGLFYTTHHALPLMSSGAIIVNNLSVAARQAFAGMSAYCAAKAGALGFTNVLREELRPRGIRVVALIPGATDTEIWRQFWPEALREKMMATRTVADLVLSAVTLPPEVSLDELIVTPSSGAL